MHSKLSELKEMETKWNSIVNKIECTVEKAPQRVKLDIGGKLFSASIGTLMAIPNTYFYGLVANSDKFKPLDDGTYFIDRNPLVFDRILDYLRTGQLETRELTLLAKDILKDDLDYYCIPVPENLQVPPLCWDVNKKSDGCSYTNNNLTVAKIPSFGDLFL